MVYNLRYWGNDLSCENKLLAINPGLYTIHSFSFAKILF